MKSRIPVHYRTRFIAGSALNATKPPQEPSVPLSQVEREADLLATVLQDRKARRKTVSAREQFALTRREIADLLDDPRVLATLDADEQRHYRQLSAGNLSEKELGREIMADTPAPETALEQADEENWTRRYIEDLENRIIARAQFCGKRFAAHKPVEPDTFDRTLGEDAAAQEREIDASGGAAIGGSVIGGEKRLGSKPGTTFRPPKGITSFEKGGKIRWQPGGSGDQDTTGGELSESDDYGEESSA